MSSIFNNREPLKEIMGSIKYFRKENIPFDEYIYTFGKDMDDIDIEFKRNFYETQTPRMKIIDEIPVMITKFGEIVCIPKLHELKSIAIFGKTGMGKTILLHTLVDWFYHYYNYNPVLINDWKFENYSWLYPNSSKQFNKYLSTLGIKQCSLPLVPIIPNIVGTKKIEGEYFNVIMKIPFKDFLNNIRTFVDFEKSEKYHELIKDELINCNTIEQVYDILKENISNKDVSGKIYAEIISYQKEGLISFNKEIIGNIGTYPTQKGKMKEIGTLFPQMIKCNLVPSLVTTRLNKGKHSPNLIKYIIDDLIDNKKNDGILKDKKIIFCIDELNELLKIKDKKENIKDAISEVMRTGRGIKMATLFCAQNRKQIPPQIASECSYTFMFHSDSSVDRSLLKSDFMLSDEEGKEIRELETFECMGFTNEKFIVYDPIRNKKYETKSARGKIIFPLSHHKHPDENSRIRTYDVIGNSENVPFQEYTKQFLKYNEITLFNPENNKKLYLGEHIKKIPLFNFNGSYIINYFDYGKYFYGDLKKTLFYSELKRLNLVIIKRKIKSMESSRKNQEIMYEIKESSEVGDDCVVMQEKPSDIFLIKYDKNRRELLLSGKDCSPYPYKLV